jgi:putative DNA primase/helicase
LLYSDFLSKIAGASYLPDAYSERFQEYIDEIMSGDREKAKFLQKSLGYAVSGDTRHECLFFLYGETSRNGKGTLMESVLKVMGDYGKAVRPETISNTKPVIKIEKYFVADSRKAPVAPIHLTIEGDKK